MSFRLEALFLCAEPYRGNNPLNCVWVTRRVGRKSFLFDLGVTHKKIDEQMMKGMAFGKMLFPSADCISHYFLKPGFPLPSLSFVFPPFIAIYIIYSIDSKVDMGMGIFFGRAVYRINHLAMVFLVKIICHLPCNCINVQIVFLYELFGFGVREKNSWSIYLPKSPLRVRICWTASI